MKYIHQVFISHTYDQKKEAFPLLFPFVVIFHRTSLDRQSCMKCHTLNPLQFIWHHAYNHNWAFVTSKNIWLLCHSNIWTLGFTFIVNQKIYLAPKLVHTRTRWNAHANTRTVHWLQACISCSRQGIILASVCTKSSLHILHLRFSREDFCTFIPVLCTSVQYSLFSITCCRELVPILISFCSDFKVLRSG